MIREHVFSGSTPSDKYFRWRGGNVSRLESLSDVVFAICLTMLVALPVSRSFDKEYDELIYSIKMLPAFLVSFLILIWIWYAHYQFFRRYGLGDWMTVALNTVLLFLVVSYTYPLRFVFSFLLDGMVGLDPRLRADRSTSDATMVMYFYSSGFVAIFLVLCGMHAWAWLRRHALQLDRVETYMTRAAMRSNLLTMSVGILSLILLWFGEPAIAGMIYAALGLVHGVHGWTTGAGVARLQKQMAADNA